ncbi:MAG TPA: SDR family oxidoreductase [Candidatus Acidoferrum sp.]|jgi:uncharacterized protein YbjT (DUF2867 family)
MILITGATGTVGAEVVKRLSERGTPTRAFVRNRAQAQAIALPGVEVVEGDFTKPETFTRALEGADRLFLLIPSSSQVEKQQRSLVDAAKRSGVRHIVKLSQLGADTHSPGRFQRHHGAVENHIVRSGIAYTFLRPNLFMQALLNFRSAISSQGTLFGAARNAKISLVDVRDIAFIAERVLTESGHEGETYDITGPEALTHAKMADQLSEALGKPIKYVDVPLEAFREALLSFGLPPWQAEGVVEDYEQYRRNEASLVTSTVRDVTGNDPIVFSRFAHDYAAKFLRKAAGASRK